MNPRMIDVLVLHPSDYDGKPWSIETINGDDYREIVRLVQGNLGTCSLPQSLHLRGFFAYCDDDANIRDDTAPNEWSAWLGQAKLRGPIVILRADETGTEQGLDQGDVLWWTDYLMGPPSAEAFKSAMQSALWWQAHPSGFSIESVPDAETLLNKLGLAEENEVDW